MVDRADVIWALTELAQQKRRYQLFDSYYRGDHRLTFATDKFRHAFGTSFQAFSDNLCPVVVDSLADRLSLSAFSGDPDAAKDAEELWRANRMDRRQGEIHLGSAKLGDAYLIVWPNSEGEVRLWPQEPSNIVVDYDMDEAPDKITRAAKWWKNADNRWRLNLYFPDRIEKLVTRSVPRIGTTLKPAMFVEYVPDDGSGATVDNKFGVVPVFHFPNNAGTGEYGRSELKDVLPLQDALNKSVADMLVAMEFIALPQRYVTGLQVETDPITGEPKAPNFQPGADRLWAALGDNVKFGEFAPASLQQFLSVQDSFRVEIARVAGLPLHYLTPNGGTPPSGEALKVAEARLVKRAQDRQVALGNIWEDVIALAIRLKRQSPNAQIALEAVWEDAETRNELFEAQTQLTKQQLGVSQPQSLREMGYSDELILKMKDEQQASGDAFAAAAMMAAQRDHSVSTAQGAAFNG